MNLEFSKYQGLGNDFLLVWEQEVDADLARYMCDRFFGVGADGVIRLTRSESADFQFTLFNADGSIAEVSGNGLRCVGKFLYDKGFFKEDSIKVDAGGEIKVLELTVENGEVSSVRVDMGIPLDEGEIELHGHLWRRVNTGNPHVVTFVDDLDRAPVSELGPLVEIDPLFPERTNVHFIRVDGDLISARFWERGVGVTLACGTGSVAALIASGLERAIVRNPGGDLELEKDSTGHVFMTGPVAHVFDGRLA